MHGGSEAIQSLERRSLDLHPPPHLSFLTGLGVVTHVFRNRDTLPLRTPMSVERASREFDTIAKMMMLRGF